MGDNMIESASMIIALAALIYTFYRGYKDTKISLLNKRIETIIFLDKMLYYADWIIVVFEDLSKSEQYVYHQRVSVQTIKEFYDEFTVDKDVYHFIQEIKQNKFLINNLFSPELSGKTATFLDSFLEILNIIFEVYPRDILNTYVINNKDNKNDVFELC